MYQSVKGMGAYYASKFEQPISGMGACPCAAQSGVGSFIGDDSNYPGPGKFALAIAASALVVWATLKIKL